MNKGIYRSQQSGYIVNLNPAQNFGHYIKRFLLKILCVYRTYIFMVQLFTVSRFTAQTLKKFTTIIRRGIQTHTRQKKNNYAPHKDSPRAGAYPLFKAGSALKLNIITNERVWIKAHAYSYPEAIRRNNTALTRSGAYKARFVPQKPPEDRLMAAICVFPVINAPDGPAGLVA